MSGLNPIQSHALSKMADALQGQANAGVMIGVHAHFESVGNQLRRAGFIAPVGGEIEGYPMVIRYGLTDDGLQWVMGNYNKWGATTCAFC